jgi:hypothetical protein
MGGNPHTPKLNKLQADLDSIFDNEWSTFTGELQDTAILWAYRMCRDIPRLATLFSIPPETIDALIEDYEEKGGWCAWQRYLFNKYLVGIKQREITILLRSMRNEERKKQAGEAMVAVNRLNLQIVEPTPPAYQKKGGTMEKVTSIREGLLSDAKRDA